MAEVDMLKFKSQELTPRVLADLKKRSTIGIIFYPTALSIVIFSGSYYQRQPSFSNQFLVLLAGICLFRLVHMWLDRRLPQNRANTAIFLTSVILTALIWGIGYAKFSFQQEELYTQMLMVTCTIGLCSGGVVAFIPFLPLSLGFNACIMVPGIISLLVFGNNYPLGFLFILFFIYMVFMAYRQNHEYWTALDNESLLEQKTEELKRLSNRDGLTGLYNRRYFDRAFSYEWKRAVRKNTPIVILICDVDHFKNVNDQYGHMAGDECLRMISGFLERIFRRETDVVARYGGEEFVILMPDERIETARDQAEKARQLVESTPIKVEGHSILTTISIGLANMVPGPDMEKEQLLSRADEALYMAKSQGRNRICINLSD